MLPAFLLGPSAILWLWILPVAVLGFLNFQGYWLVAGEMNADQLQNARIMGLTLLVNAVLGCGCYCWDRWRCARAGVDCVPRPFGGFVAVIVQAVYLWIAMEKVGQLLPRSVTTWIYTEDRFVFNQFAFAMLPLFAGILRLAGSRPTSGQARAFAVNLGLAVGAPVLLYLLFTAHNSLFRNHQVSGTFVAIAVVVLGTVMFIALVRTMLILFRKLDVRTPRAKGVAVVLFALAIPLGGLWLNRSIPFPIDFQAWEVYALVAANACFLLLATFQHERRPLLSFCLLCATLPFSLYFFIVFLPFLPLAIIAVLLLGTGFLILAPTLLFTMHLYLLNAALRSLRAELGRGRIFAIGVLCALLLPAFFTGRGLMDKAALNAALDYACTPVIKTGNRTYQGSLINLRRALANHRSYKNGIYYPLISDYYSWLVFDNLVLPDDKLALLEKTFLGTTSSQTGAERLRRGDMFFGRGNVRSRSRGPRAATLDHKVTVSHLMARAGDSDADGHGVTMTLTLENNGARADEYVTTLALPSGVYVKGFRLKIGDKLVPGKIFEKKTALWVYSMIRDSERRDPGLLFYSKPGEIELRVFPVVPSSPTVVEIDFITPHNISVEDLYSASNDPSGFLTQLAGKISPQLVVDSRGNATVLAVDASLMPRVEREPYLHLIIDRSVENGFTGNLSDVVARLKKQFPSARRARVTMANYNVFNALPELTPLDEIAARIGGDLEKLLPLSGGLQLDNAVACAICRHRDTDLDGNPRQSAIPPEPIFVVLSAKAMADPLNWKATDFWGDLLPRLEIHAIGADGSVSMLRHADGSAKPLLRVGNSIRSLQPGLGVRFQAGKGGDPIEYWQPESTAWISLENVTQQTVSNPWTRVVELHSKQQDFDRSPGEAIFGLKDLVKASRETGALIGSTSYIVVENSAQWKILELSQQKKMDQNSALEFQEAPAPSTFMLFGGLVVWMGIRRWRGTRGVKLSLSRG